MTTMAEFEEAMSVPSPEEGEKEKTSEVWNRQDWLS